jgi:hypothetical protein
LRIAGVDGVPVVPAQRVAGQHLTGHKCESESVLHFRSDMVYLGFRRFLLPMIALRSEYFFITEGKGEPNPE